MNMIQKGFLKPNLTYQRIGTTNFWQGVFFGLASSIILALFMNFSREIFRYFSILNELVEYPELEYFYSDLFYSLYASLFGFGVCLMHWFKIRDQSRKTRLRLSFAKSNIFLFLVISLLAISRMGTVILLPLVNLPGFDNHLNFHLEFPEIFVFMSIFLILFFWQGIQMEFKLNYWKFYSAAIIISWTFLLFSFLRVDRNIVDEAYNNFKKTRYLVIDQELNKAKEIGIEFPLITIETIKKHKTESKKNMYLAVEKAFKTKNSVSLDTLILQKIMIRNLDHLDFSAHSFYPYEGHDSIWIYPYPEAIYHQIKLHKPSDIETKVLFEILSELVDISNPEYRMPKEKPDYLTREEFSNLNYEKRSLILKTSTIQSRLIQVVKKLLNESQYELYHHMIIGINQEINSKYHQWVELDLN